jgi:hypothetical protein
MTNTQSKVLKIISILWIIWGLVHALAGVMTISQDTPAAIAGIADAVDPAMLTGPYHDAAGALINQHGWNLLWIGLFTTVGAVFIWQSRITWLFFTAVVGGITDVGYFLFMDLGGYVNFFPGTVMTFISGAAILLSFWVWFTARRVR